MITGATQPSAESPVSVVVWPADGSGGIVVVAALATPPVRVFGVAAVGDWVGDLGEVVVGVPLRAAAGSSVGCAVGVEEMRIDVGDDVVHSHV